MVFFFALERARIDSMLKIIKFIVGLALCLAFVTAAIVTVFDINVFENFVKLYQEWFCPEPIFIMKPIRALTLNELIQKYARHCWRMCGNLLDHMVATMRVIRLFFFCWFSLF